jgi:hypothetical protein
VRHAHLRIVGEVEAKPCSDLLRRPALPKPTLDLGPQPRTGRELRLLGTTRLGERPRIRPGCPVAAPAAVTLKLPRHRRGRPAKPACDHHSALPAGNPERDLLPLNQRQKPRRAAPLIPTHATPAQHPAEHRPRVTPDRDGHLRLRLTRSDPTLDLVPLPLTQPPPPNPPPPPRHTKPPISRQNDRPAASLRRRMETTSVTLLQWKNT